MPQLYKDKFPIGSRVKVSAPASEGSDHAFTGRTGTVIAHGGWFTIDFDKPPHGWPNPYTGVCPHNLREAH